MIIEVPPKTDPFFVKMKEGALPATDGHEALKAVGIKHGILTMPDDGGPGLRKVADGIIGTTPMQNGVDGRRMCVWCVVCVTDKPVEGIPSITFTASACAMR